LKRLIKVIEKQKKKIRKYSIPFVMLFVSTAAQASCSKLAKSAGLSQHNLKNIVTKLVKIETTSGKYTVENSRSGAYGKYQILPSTANFYAKKLNIPRHLWKKPYNQDKIFRAIMNDNIKSLKRNGYRVSAFSLYATHQQGAVGFNSIMKNKPLSVGMEKNLRANLPSNLRKVKKSQLRTTWIHYWKKKLG
jgi:hypothetical protein